MLLKAHNISYLSPNNLLFGYKKSPKLEDDFAVWTGLEPATPCVTGMYSNQLNYQTCLNGCKYTLHFCYLKIKIH